MRRSAWGSVDDADVEDQGRAELSITYALRQLGAEREDLVGVLYQPPGVRQHKAAANAMEQGRAHGSFSSFNWPLMVCGVRCRVCDARAMLPSRATVQKYSRCW